MGEATPAPRDVLQPIWRLQWATPRQLQEWAEQGVAYMTAERLAKLVREAQAQGFASGEQQGRYNLRKAVEAGEIEPIGPQTVAPGRGEPHGD